MDDTGPRTYRVRFRPSGNRIALPADTSYHIYIKADILKVGDGTVALLDGNRNIVAVYPLDQIVGIEKLTPKKPSDVESAGG